MLRRAFMGAALAAAVTPVAACGGWSQHLLRAGTLQAALRQIRHHRPALLGGVILLTMPSTVAVHMAAEEDRRFETMTWTDGRVAPGAETGDLPPETTLFDLLRDVPLVADIQHMAQRHLGEEGVFAPSLATAKLWLEGEQMFVDATLDGVSASVLLRVDGDTLNPV
ncbi:hypothetical protein [Propioniferax innocua]|nr:hypothetical protein [Propioniferax innocua]